MENEKEILQCAKTAQEKNCELRKKIVDDINLLTGGHEGNPIIGFRDWDAHRYDYGTFTDPRNSVNWYKKKIANKERVTLDDVVMYNVLQAFNVGVEDPKLFAKHAGIATAILNRMIFMMSMEDDK